MTPFWISALVQVVTVAFAAGVLWSKLSDIASRVQRIEQWIDGDSEREGNRLKR